MYGPFKRWSKSKYHSDTIHREQQVTDQLKILFADYGFPEEIEGWNIIPGLVDSLCYLQDFRNMGAEPERIILSNYSTVERFFAGRYYLYRAARPGNELDVEDILRGIPILENYSRYNRNRYETDVESRIRDYYLDHANMGEFYSKNALELVELLKEKSLHRALQIPTEPQTP